MGRLIDADSVKFTNFEIVMCEGDFKQAFKLLCEKLDDAPTVDAEPQWIPVSERLPEEDGYYLVTMKSTDTNEIWVEKCRFFKDEWYQGFLTIITERVARILAWMPLPEPYKETVENLVKVM